MTLHLCETDKHQQQKKGRGNGGSLSRFHNEIVPRSRFPLPRTRICLYYNHAYTQPNTPQIETIVAATWTQTETQPAPPQTTHMPDREVDSRLETRATGGPNAPHTLHMCSRIDRVEPTHTHTHSTTNNRSWWHAHDIVTTREIITSPRAQWCCRRHQAWVRDHHELCRENSTMQKKKMMPTYA